MCIFSIELLDCMLLGFKLYLNLQDTAIQYWISKGASKEKINLAMISGGSLRGFKLQLILFANQLAKNDLSHFPRLNSIAPVMKDKLRSYEDSLRRLRGEFERRFQDFSAIEKDLDIFSMPFNVDCETVKPDLQLELIELRYNTQLRQLFLNVPKLEFYKSL